VSLRYRQYLRERYQALFGYMGEMVLVIGLLFLVPLLVIPFYPDEAKLAGGFLLTALPLIALGLWLWRRLAPREPLSLTVQEGMVIMMLVWLLAILAGTIPFMTAAGLDFTHAVFESTSGWTTTGLSVVDVTQQPRIVLFYRSFIQFAGGAGFAIIMLSAIAGPPGSGLSVAEGRSEQLAPHVRRSASIVLRIYLAYAIIGVPGLRLAGMDWFDAVNHAFTGLATGGFSTRPESIGYWDSAWIEMLLVALMLLGALNFLTAYTLLRGKFYAVRHNGEVRLTAVVIPVAALLLVVFITAQIHPTGKAFRTAIFEATSALTGTGFTTTDYHRWGDFGWLAIIVLMIIGGGTGSTSGGLKQLRVYVLYKALVWEFRRAFMPQHTINEPAIWEGDRRGFLSDQRVRRVTLYVFLFLGIYITGSAIVTLHGYSLRDSLFEFASAVATVGLSVGITTPDAPLSLLWTQILGMYLGRLEFFAIFIGIAKLLRDGWTLARRPRPELEG
jgi:trk system potassium uptake protein